MERLDPLLTYPNQEAVSTRDLAWNTAGEQLVDGPMSALMALRSAGLAGWGVRKVPVMTAPGDTALDGDWGLIVPDKYANVATIKGEPRIIGLTGKRHVNFQNEEMAEFLDTVVDDSGAHFVAGGLLAGGSRTFMVMKMPSGILIAGEDATDLYFGATNSFDGSGSFTAWVTGVRLRCTNMLNSAVKGAKARWKMRHSGQLQGKVAQAREALSLTFRWAEEFEKEAEEFLASPFSESDWNRLLDHLAPESESTKAGWVKRQEEKRETLTYLFREAETNELGRGTKWGAYNAFTEYADWFLPIKGKDPQGTKRAVRTIDGPIATSLKQRAYDALVVL